MMFQAMGGAGIAPSSHRGTNLKGTEVSNLFEYFEYIFLTIPGIFGCPSYDEKSYSYICSLYS